MEKLKDRNKMEITCFICAIALAIMIIADIVFWSNPIYMNIMNNINLIAAIAVHSLAIIGLLFGILAIIKGSKKLITIIGVFINGSIVTILLIGYITLISTIM